MSTRPSVHCCVCRCSLSVARSSADGVVTLFAILCLLCAVVVAPSLSRRRRRAVVVAAFDRLSSFARLCPVLLAIIYFSITMDYISKSNSFQSKGRFDGNIIVSLKPAHERMRTVDVVFPNVLSSIPFIPTRRIPPPSMERSDRYQWLKAFGPHRCVYR